MASVGKEYPNKNSVVLLAEKHLAPVNTRQLQPESAMLVEDFIKDVFLPHVERELRPSTYKHYKKDLFEKHVKGRLGDLRLRDFRTVHGQKLLRSISVGRRTLVHIKVFLSATFKHALREGFLDGHNPMQNVSVPGRPDKNTLPVYSMSEIERIAEKVGAVDIKAFAAVTVAAFAGLRMSEIRGLRWQDYDGQTLQIRRSVWRSHVGPTKTERSAGCVPVLPTLKKVLDEYRSKVNGKPEDYMFAGKRRGAPLNLANLVRRVIIPALNKSEDGPYAELTAPPVWRGFHAYRRSLATNLYACGVSPKVIQAIMRHSDIGTTLAYYVSTPDEDARAALQKIEDWVASI